MAENGDRGPMPYLGLLVGGLIVATIVVGFFLYSGYGGHNANVPSHLSLNVKARHT